MAVGKFTIRNDNDSSVRDIAIACNFSGKSGTVLTEAGATIYDVVPAKSTKTFNNVNIGLIHSQAASGNCDLRKVSR